MPTTVALIATLLLLASPIAHAQDSRTALEAVARAMGADSVKSLEYTGLGVNFAPGQSQTPGQRWPRFNLKTFTRTINYETAALRSLLMAYLPKERMLIQADTFTPPPANTPPPVPPASFAVNLADNITRRGLNVDRLLPLHGRIVPLADLYRAIGRAP